MEVTDGGKGGSGNATAGTGEPDAMGGAQGPSADPDLCDDGRGNAGAPGTAPDEAGEPVHDQTFVDVRFENASCSRTGASGVSCSATTAATRGDIDLVLPTWEGGFCSTGTAYAYDDRGNRYVATAVRFASQTQTSYCPLAVTLIEGVSAELRYDFDDFSASASEITLLHFNPRVGDVVEQAALRRLPVSSGEAGAWTAEGTAALGRALGSFTSQQVEISYYPCRVQSSGDLTCPLVFRSHCADRALALPVNLGAFCSRGLASAFDDQGNELAATRLDVANETTTNPCGLQRVFVRAVPTLVTYNFGPVGSDVESIPQLRIAPLVVDGAAQDMQIPAVPIER